VLQKKVFDYEPRRPTAPRSQFTLHFIKTGKLDKKYGRLLSELFDWRQKGDYENIFDYDNESVKPLFPIVFDMLTEINKLIEKI